MRTTINLNEEFPHQEIVFQIERFGTIIGTLRAMRREIVAEHAGVAARLLGQWESGDATTGNAMTDDQGRFRLPFVTRGRYRICGRLRRAACPLRR